MNIPSCSDSTSTVSDYNDQPGTSFDGGNEQVASSEELEDKTDTVDENPSNSVIRPEFRAAHRRRLHQCIATMADRQGIRRVPRTIRLRFPPMAIERRLDLRRLWMYMDAVAAIRLSRVPPGG